MNFKLKEVKVKNILIKSNLPLGGYSANPYIGCSFACKYCYACFMKRFTGHKENWGEFIDVKFWEKLKKAEKYKGERIVIGSVTDGYNHFEKEYERTKKLLLELKNSEAKITICTRSDLVLRDIDILKELKDITVSFSINTLDEKFRKDMDRAVSIKRRIEAMKKIYDEGIRTVCFISPIFPGITDVKEIISKIKNCCDFVWLENLNLRGSFKASIMDYIKENYKDLYPLYQEIYQKNEKTYWENLKNDLKKYALENNFPYYDNYLPDGRSEKGRPAIVNYLYHEEVSGTKNTGNRKGND